MSFDLSTILIFGTAAVLYSALPGRWRGWALLVGSVTGVYWLQTLLPIRFMDFILPTATLVLTVAGWVFTRKPDDEEQAATWPQDRVTLAVIVALILGVAAMRYLAPELRLTPSRPPDPVLVALVLAGTGAVVAGIWRLTRSLNQWNFLTGVILFMVGLFVLLKTEPLTVELSRFFRAQAGQDETLAAFTDLAWLGFSYVAFRLIHTLRDRQTGKLPAMSLREYVSYVVFFPSFIAGPIDRAERFVKDYRALPEMRGYDPSRYVEGTTRIAVGVFKKFVIADTLALGMSLNAINAEQATSAPALWLLVYGYALRIFFDFSGYTDIAIGIGILFGVKLPENFNRPYFKSNLASFWQSWHMTLSNWARFYVFTPLSRVLLMRQPKPSPTVIVFSTQMATMLVIGLWHGVTVGFLMWGAWHGFGLFVHKMWSDRTRKWYLGLREKPAQQRVWAVTGWFITFHYVVLGWVWFALPDFDVSLMVFARLFGVAW